MIPEGLEFASADQILSNVSTVGWNFIRMLVSQNSLCNNHG